MSQIPAKSHASSPASFSNQLLIALPALDDPQFARSVALICQHDDEGAMGVVVNRASEYSLGDVLAQMNLEARDPALANQIVLSGGPVHPERGFVLHDGERQWDSTLAIGGGLALTTSRDILEAMAEGEGPAHVVVALGCAGWGAGQLEYELGENSWLTAPADAELLFALPLEQRWQAAGGRLGIDITRVTDYSGHA
jgi:putative transcriptional regulator